MQPPKSAEESIATVRPGEPANAILEINAGLSDKYGIKNGDEVKIEK
jgi:uncharacterized membrane protein (UPF0127 family)